MADTETHSFNVSARWRGDVSGSGEAMVSDGALAVPIAGATGLGGAGGKANPEELLLAAIAACFVSTWAIFLKKLAIPHPEPALRVSGVLGKDPGGGFRMEKAVVHVAVPAALLAGRRGQVEKSLQLAEKYCIVSKVARAAMPLSVEIEEAP